MAALRDALDEAAVTLKPVLDELRRGEQITAEIMNFRFGSRSAA